MASNGHIRVLREEQAKVAQLAEQRYRKPRVAGSIPALGSKKYEQKYEQKREN